MFRIVLLLIYVAIYFINHYLPNIITSNGEIFMFSWIVLVMLQDIDWMILKKSCKNRKDWLCRLLFKKPKSDEKNMDP